MLLKFLITQNNLALICGFLHEEMDKINMVLDKQNIAVALCTHCRPMMLDNGLVLHVYCKPLKFVFLALCTNCMLDYCNMSQLSAKGLVRSSLSWRLLTYLRILYGPVK